MLKRLLLCSISIIMACNSNAAYLPAARGNAGMVVSAQHYATEAGFNILKEGGNAVDAAVAVAYALAVVDPCCGNLGGGGFMLIHNANGKDVFFNFREKAPEAFSNKLFFKDGIFDQSKRHSMLAVGVPGTVMGLNAALRTYGTMPRATVMQPAIQLAQNGFALNRWDAQKMAGKSKELNQDANVAAIFLRNGHPYVAGDILKQPQLAKTLKSISDEGDKVFYHGWIAKEIVAASQQHGGVLTMQDFQRYRVKVVEPLRCTYRGISLLTAPPPGSGAIVCAILNIVEGYPLASMGIHSAAATHVNVEAMRYAFQLRNQLGDPDKVAVPVTEIISKTTAKNIRRLIVNGQAGKSQPTIQIQSNGKAHTTHLSVIDKFGNAVSLTVTLNGFFGNYKIAGNTGFFLNNELDDFSLNPGKGNMFQLVQGKANEAAPGKRPLSAMSPTILLKDGKPFLILGAAGGPTIITSVTQTVENVIDFKVNLNGAVNFPRYHMQWLPDKIFIEPNAFSADTMNILTAMGYRFQHGSPFSTRYWGQVAAIMCDPDKKYCQGAGDNRYPAGLAQGVEAP